MKKMKKAITSIVIAGMVLTMIPFNAFAMGTVQSTNGQSTGNAAQAVNNKGGSSHTATLDKLITGLMSYQGYLNQSEKDSINEARANLLTAVQDGTLNSAANELLTNQVVARFQVNGISGSDAKAQIIKSLVDFQAIHYSDDKAALETALLKFKMDNGRTFRILFGTDFKTDLLYGFILASQDELQKVIKEDIKRNPSTIFYLEFGTSTEIKAKFIEWLRTALHNVADPMNSKYHVFDQKLADLGWSINLLVNTERQIGTVIDPSNAAEKAMEMSVIRSQIKCKVDGVTSNPFTPVTLKKGDNKLKLDLSIKGIDTGVFNIAGMLAWKSENPAIAAVAEDGSSIKAGTTKGSTVITAYRMNDSQIESNELIRIAVAVN